MTEVTLKDFSTLAKKRGWTKEHLAELFRKKIEEPSEFFDRVLSCKSKGEDRSSMVIPYSTVIEFYRKEVHYFLDSHPARRQCACGCGQPVLNRKKWASPACQEKWIAKKAVADVSDAQKSLF